LNYGDKSFRAAEPENTIRLQNAAARSFGTLPLSRTVKAEIAAGELVYFQRIARRYTKAKQKESE
jgi:hypothetical protein